MVCHHTIPPQLPFGCAKVLDEGLIRHAGARIVYIRSGLFLCQLEAKGFRNPFRLTVAPVSDDVIIADVGLDTMESIKVVPDPLATPLGASLGNHGWPCIEGDAWIPPFTNQ